MFCARCPPPQPPKLTLHASWLEGVFYILLILLAQFLDSVLFGIAFSSNGAAMAAAQTKRYSAAAALIFRFQGRQAGR